MVARLANINASNTFEFLKTFEPDFDIKPVHFLRKTDSLYTIMVYEPTSKENVPHRVLESSFIFNGQPYAINIKIHL